MDEELFKKRLTNPGVDNIELRAFADMEAARRAQAADRPMRVSSRRPKDPNEAKYKREVYKELGLAASEEDNFGAKFGAQSENRIAAQKEKNQAAQAEASRRDGIRDSNSIDSSKNISDGLTGRQIFQDDKGRVEGPAELKGRLMKEGSDINDATIAAGERYRDMFGLPNAKSEGFGRSGGQRDAVMSAPKGLKEDGTSPRMDVMAKLKDARTDNLKSLTEQRLADPNRKPVGTITSIESSDGRVLAKRGEGEAVVARGGTQGAVGGTEDRPGALTLTRDGENAIRDRLTVNKTEGGGTTVTGRYGTAMSGPKSMTDQLKDRGMIAKDFQLTPEQKTGQAALPKEYTEGRDKLLAESGQTAKSQGTVVGDAKPLLDRMAPGTAQAIDQKADKIAADLKQQKEDKLGSDFLTAYKNSGGRVSSPSDPNKTLFTANGMQVNAADVAANNRALPKELGGQGMNLRDAAKPTSLGVRPEKDVAAMAAFLKADEERKRRSAQSGRGI